MVNYKTNEILGIIGKRGEGKSVYGRKVIDQVPRGFIFDTMREHSNFGGVITDPSILLTVLSRAKWSKIVYQPQYKPEEPEFNKICKVLFEYNNDFVFMVEEIGDYCNPHYIPKELSRIVRTGRHKGIGFIGVSQRARGFHSDIFSQGHWIVSFKQDHPKDIEFLRSYFGEKAKELKDLPRFHYMVYSVKDGYLGTFEPVKI